MFIQFCRFLWCLSNIHPLQFSTNCFLSQHKIKLQQKQATKSYVNIRKPSIKINHRYYHLYYIWNIHTENSWHFWLTEAFTDMERNDEPDLASGLLKSSVRHRLTEEVQFLPSYVYLQKLSKNGRTSQIIYTVWYSYCLTNWEQISSTPSNPSQWL